MEKATSNILTMKKQKMTCIWQEAWLHNTFITTNWLNFRHIMAHHVSFVPSSTSTGRITEVQLTVWITCGFEKIKMQPTVSENPSQEQHQSNLSRQIRHNTHTAGLHNTTQVSHICLENSLRQCCCYDSWVWITLLKHFKRGSQINSNFFVKLISSFLQNLNSFFSICRHTIIW